MTPSLRTMPTVTATFDPSARHWTVYLPGGFALNASTAADVEELVAKHASGAAIRWIRPDIAGKSPQRG